jgi:hypothetical protein
MRKAKEHENSIHAFQEWQEHQYLEGYYVGGRIPPSYLGKRPNRFGYVLLANGILLALVATLGAFSWARFGDSDLGTLIALVFIGAIAALHLMAAARLLRKPSGKRDRRKYPISRRGRG